MNCQLARLVSFIRSPLSQIYSIFSLNKKREREKMAHLRFLTTSRFAMPIAIATMTPTIKNALVVVGSAGVDAGFVDSWFATSCAIC